MDKAFTGGKHIFETKTDENGFFEFRPVFKRSIATYLPQEFAIGQHIVVTYAGRDFDLWVGVKRTAAENAEARGNPLLVACDLSWEPMEIQGDGGVYITLCRWGVTPDKVAPIAKLPGPVDDDNAW